MKKSTLVITAIILLAIIMIPTGMLIGTRRDLERVRLSVASRLFNELRELEWGLAELVSDENADRCPYDAALVRIHKSLGKINGALCAARPLLPDSIHSSEFIAMPDGIEGLEFIAGCLSASYSADWNNDRIEGILVDGVIDDREYEYIERLRAELIELRAPLLREDGLNFNSNVDFEAFMKQFEFFLDRFYYGFDEKDPAWSLLAR